MYHYIDLLSAVHESKPEVMCMVTRFFLNISTQFKNRCEIYYYLKTDFFTEEAFF